MFISVTLCHGNSELILNREKIALVTDCITLVATAIIFGVAIFEWGTKFKIISSCSLATVSLVNLLNLVVLNNLNKKNRINREHSIQRKSVDHRDEVRNSEAATQEEEFKTWVVLEINTDGQKEKGGNILIGEGEDEINHWHLLEPHEECIEQIGAGKAKKVLIRKGEEEFVYYVPVQNILRTKEAEIKREVAIAKAIRKKLYQQSLVQALVSVRCKKAHAYTYKILGCFKTPEDFFEGLQNLPVNALAKKLQVSRKASQKIKDSQSTIRKIVTNAWKHLAIDLIEVVEEERIEKHYTARTKRANNDLESVLKEKNLTIATRVKYASDYLHGMAALAAAGMVHGDLKPENVLVYNDGLKISDFGKTGIAGSSSYTGNGRFAAPERLMTKEADVFSAGMIVMRILEEDSQLLDKKTQMVCSPEHIDPLMKPSPKRRGIEKFAIMNDFMTQNENTLRGKIRTYGSKFFAKQYDLNKAEAEMYKYIDKLTARLQEIKSVSPNQATNLNTLLKNMTRSRPHLRPTIEEAAVQFDAIMR